MKNVRIDNSFRISNYRFRPDRDIICIRKYMLLRNKGDYHNGDKLNQDIFDGKPNRIDELNRLLNSIYKIDENIEFNGNTSSSLDEYIVITTILRRIFKRLKILWRIYVRG